MNQPRRVVQIERMKSFKSSLLKLLKWLKTTLTQWIFYLSCLTSKAQVHQKMENSEMKMAKMVEADCLFLYTLNLKKMMKAQMKITKSQEIALENLMTNQKRNLMRILAEGLEITVSLMSLIWMKRTKKAVGRQRSHLKRDKVVQANKRATQALTSLKSMLKLRRKKIHIHEQGAEGQIEVHQTPLKKISHLLTT